MYYQLLFAVLVVSASSQSLWDAVLGTASNLIGGIWKGKGTRKPEDGFLSIYQLARKNGYPLDAHGVVTEDGYKLTMHRMTFRKNVTSSRRVVFLMHGIWDSSDGWLLQGKKKALAYILADQGFDVWMGNARGNRHSLAHTTLKPDMSKFWEFSWEEIGLYDLPAMIDYVLKFTGEKQLFYVGFSQGTTAYFVMNSIKPEYNEKIRLMFAMAPAVYLGQAQNMMLKFFSPAHSLFKYVLWNFNIYSPSTDFFNKIGSLVCNIIPGGCDNIFMTIAGPHHVKESLWPVILGHVPTGASTLQFVHYGQLAFSKRFCRYDYGRKMNKEIYKQAEPPDYNLEAVTSPIILYYGGQDYFSDWRDVESLKKMLPKVVESCYLKQYTHIDFMYAADAAKMVYFNIVNQIKSRSDGNVLVSTQVPQPHHF